MSKPVKNSPIANLWELINESVLTPIRKTVLDSIDCYIWNYSWECDGLTIIDRNIIPYIRVSIEDMIREMHSDE